MFTEPTSSATPPCTYELSSEKLLHVIGGALQKKRITLGGGGLKGTVRVPSWDPSWGVPAFAGVLGGQAIGFDGSVLVVHIPKGDRIVNLVGPTLPAQPFHDGAVLLRLLRRPDEHVNVDAEFTFTVAFDEGWPGNGEPVIPLLEQLVVATEQVVVQFAALLAN